MEYTTFDHHLWNISSFNTIGYDKKQKILHIHFNDRRVFQYVGVEENIVFQFIIALDKEKFYRENIHKHHEYTVHRYKIPS